MERSVPRCRSPTLPDSKPKHTPSQHPTPHERLSDPCPTPCPTLPHRVVTPALSSQAGARATHARTMSTRGPRPEKYPPARPSERSRREDAPLQRQPKRRPTHAATRHAPASAKAVPPAERATRLDGARLDGGVAVQVGQVGRVDRLVANPWILVNRDHLERWQVGVHCVPAMTCVQRGEGGQVGGLRRFGEKG